MATTIRLCGGLVADAAAWVGQHLLRWRQRVAAAPATDDLPPVWALCSSLSSAEQWLDWLEANGYPPCCFDLELRSVYAPPASPAPAASVESGVLASPRS
jgi:hypothetical protein